MYKNIFLSADAELFALHYCPLFLYVFWKMPSRPPQMLLDNADENSVSSTTCNPICSLFSLSQKPSNHIIPHFAIVT